MLGGKTIVEACACVRFLLEPMSVGLAVSTSCKLSLGLCLALDLMPPPRRVWKTGGLMPGEVRD